MLKSTHWNRTAIKIMDLLRVFSLQFVNEFEHYYGLWGPAVETACWIYNRTPHHGLDFVTPYEWIGQEPDVTQVRTFGSQVNVVDGVI